MTSAKCPMCGKPPVQAYDPFCGKRCADVDLSRWLKGSYAIAGAPAGEDEDGSPGITGDSGDFED